jgi:hypothetical protein
MACSCTYYDILILQSDIDDAIGNTPPLLNGTVYVDYIDCNGNPQTATRAVAGTYTNDICVTATSTPNLYYYKNDSQSIATSSASNTLTDCCPTPTPTPTPTSTPVCYLWTNLDNSAAFYNYVDCEGNVYTNQEIIVEGTICAQNGSVVYVSGGVLTQGGVCSTSVSPTPTPTMTETPSQTPTITPTISETPTSTVTPTNSQTPTTTETSTPTPTPTISETPTSTVTPTISETPTRTPTQTPTVTPTIQSIVQFQDCIDGSFVFRFGGTIPSLSIGSTYLITGSSQYEGCAQVVSYTGAGPLFNAAGVTFLGATGCFDANCPPTSKRAALLSKCSDGSLFDALVDADEVLVGGAYVYNGECYAFVSFAVDGGPYLGIPTYLSCASCVPSPTPTATPNATPVVTPSNTPTPQFSCSNLTYCLNVSLPSLSGYSGNYYANGGYYNCYYYYEGGGQNYGVIYYNDEYWCLSDSLGGECFLRGNYPCNSTCPDLDSGVFTVGPCVTPTPLPPQCNILDFEAYFECDFTPVVECDVVDFQLSAITITPTPTPTQAACPAVGISFSMSAYTPSSDITPTPTPSITPTNNYIFSGNIGFEIFTEQFSCSSVKVLVDCSTGNEYYVSESLSYNGVPIVIGIVMFAKINGNNVCVTYQRDQANLSSNSIVSEIYQIYSKCSSCSIVPSPTPTTTVSPTITVTSTETPTPSVTPSISVTPTITPTPGLTSTPTPSVTPTMTPTNSLTPSITSTVTPSPVIYYLYESCQPLNVGNPNKTQIKQTVQISGVNVIGNTFKDIGGTCWTYLGQVGQSYVPLGNEILITYSGSFIFVSNIVVYANCTDCQGNILPGAGCVQITQSGVIPNQPDSCGNYDATRTTLTATFRDSVTNEVQVATSDITISVRIQRYDCDGVFDEYYPILIPSGASQGTTSYLSVDFVYCPTFFGCTQVSRLYVDINEILPSTITPCI